MERGYINDLSIVKDNIKLRVRIVSTWMQAMHGKQHIKNIEVIIIDEHALVAHSCVDNGIKGATNAMPAMNKALVAHSCVDNGIKGATNAMPAMNKKVVQATSKFQNLLKIGMLAWGKLIRKNFTKKESMKKAFQDMLLGLGEVNPTHAYYNGS
ncbi:hypothetical protein Tco_0724355 [Tanacetum coccineum]